MRKWVSALLLPALVSAAACGSVEPAPPVQETTEVCADSFCVTSPVDWESEVTDDTISFRHPETPSAIAFASLVDMAWMLESAGASWPASLESVERAYWSLLSDPPLSPSIVIVSGSWAESRGKVQGLSRWHAVHPWNGGPVALAITVEAPSDEWEEHARTFLEGVTLLP